ncbi:nitroreductase family protein [Vitreoscilla stercoraria]|uniref:Nitroreductase family protein n=1 Tax=Vitreoscilla stercoraria TaxID=61 RepID=A0ABY4EC01_VITST|nr:nitroreductase family protein [Vitreoscilla stercoraria]UOO93280.1 nitroreductase family protein [Vitreoscilla stercoraria]
MQLIDALQHRSAVKRMTGEKLDQNVVNTILEAARLAPTSAGLQPFHIVCVSDQTLKQALAPVAFNQPQITECSHLLVFVSWDAMDDARIDQRDAEARTIRKQDASVTTETIQGLKDLFGGFTQEQQYHHSAKQAHIGMGVAIAAAALLGVAATPMEGFDKEGMDQVLHLSKLGLKSVTLLALGVQDVENDWWSKLEKVRMPMDEFVIIKP